MKFYFIILIEIQKGRLDYINTKTASIISIMLIYVILIIVV